VVIWCGQPGWDRRAATLVPTQQAALARNVAMVRAAEDSAARAGGRLKGHATERLVWTVGFDPTARQVYVLGRGYRVPAGDSALLLVVGRVDSVGGPPSVIATASISAIFPDGMRRGSPAGPEAFLAGVTELRRRLASHPAVHACIQDAP
jgi:hypothetical protein